MILRLSSIFLRLKLWKSDPGFGQRIGQLCSLMRRSDVLPKELCYYYAVRLRVIFLYAPAQGFLFAT